MTYGMLIDLKRCVGCHACSVACKEAHGTRPGVRRSRVEREFEGTYPDVRKTSLPLLCMHCEVAPCVEVCPTGASYRDSESGIVLVNEAKCIGCQYCLYACPYGVRSWNAAEKCAEKCTLCGHLTSQDKLPACVKSCAAGARFYGDLDDPDSDASKELAKYSEGDIHTLQDVGNHPATRYIMTSMIGQWQDRIGRSSAYGCLPGGRVRSTHGNSMVPRSVHRPVGGGGVACRLRRPRRL